MCGATAANPSQNCIDLLRLKLEPRVQDMARPVGRLVFRFQHLLPSAASTRAKVETIMNTSKPMLFIAQLLHLTFVLVLAAGGDQTSDALH